MLDVAKLPSIKVVNWSNLHARGCMKWRVPFSPSPTPVCPSSELTLYTKFWNETKPPSYQSSKSWSLDKSFCIHLPAWGLMRRIQPTLESQFPTVNIQRCLVEWQNIWDGTLHHLDCSLSFTEFRISRRFWPEEPLTAYLNKGHFRNKMWHSTNACTSDALTLLWIDILLSCCPEQCSPFCLVSPGKGSGLKDNDREESAGPQRATGFSLLIVISAVSWTMVWNWEDPSELWEGKLHPSQLLTNGKRKHQSDKPGVEVSGCGFKSNTVLGPACRELSWGDWLSLQSSSGRVQRLLGLPCLLTAGPKMKAFGEQNGRD